MKFANVAVYVEFVKTCNNGLWF